METMLGIIIALLIGGLLLLLLEAILPGGIVGLIGCALIGLSVFLCFSEYGWIMGSVYLVLSIVIAATVGLGSFVYAMNRFALTPPEPEDKDAQDPYVGHIGEVETSLDPTGYVLLNKRRYPARSEFTEREISKGRKVVVVRMDSTYLVVRPADHEIQDKIQETLSSRQKTG